MKYTIFLLVAFFACVSAQKPGKREDIEVSLKGFLNSLSNLVQQVLLPSVTGAIYTTLGIFRLFKFIDASINK